MVTMKNHDVPGGLSYVSVQSDKPETDWAGMAAEVFARFLWAMVLVLTGMALAISLM